MALLLVGASYISVFSFVWFGLQVWTRGMMNKKVLGKGFKALSFGAYGSFHFITLRVFAMWEIYIINFKGRNL
ncbi:hypothetical protein [Bartonella krasnovii]|uniref:Uncharacterized protein n=1 Tax=Bartonella krasnovii TaxID=2267275 RepID=A0A5B9D309_9HYPH|nr:hypothetical protein [Bartonella krasnovii]QEE12615.1 hypothetical protein D1092_06470 [Bartonella krasnovii]UNF28619.1 hypothetical protein MNL13_05135 [Bartonella krasnovii]UNF34996.1 hypothetical protein MNL12_05135 [Bartonella krasnovii]UNF36632.1 hypothetical protein MNL11_05865 [Bartonella krasnovii]UNF38403.1 hypothetical protein MNL10_06575 [Bartonella krasnovii]